MESEYDLKLCTSTSELREAYQLRVEVFHEEQKFPKETEIDSYDPVSAHFLLISKKDMMVVATVRLMPYPYPELKLHASGDVNLRTEQEIFDLSLGVAHSESYIKNEFMQALKSKVQDGKVDVSHRIVKLSRLAVRKANRLKGLGSFIVRSVEHWLQNLVETQNNFLVRDGGSSSEDYGHEKIRDMKIIVRSQMQAKNFYEKLSYVIQGDPYDEEGMLHVSCTKDIIIED